MDLNKIGDSEILYRVVRKSDPDGFIGGKPCAALFIDAIGASVDRDGQREEADIIKRLKQRFQKIDDYKTAVRITAKQCRDADTYPNPINNHKNKYHAEIWDSEDIVKISLLKAIHLAELCEEVQE